MTVRSAHRQRAGSDESGLAEHQLEPLGGPDPALAAAPEALDDGTLALADLGEIQPNRAGLDPVVRTAAGEIRHPRTGHHRLGRGTALVDAGPADMLTLDQERAPAGSCEGGGQRSPGLAGADDDGIVVHGCVHRPAG